MSYEDELYFRLISHILQTNSQNLIFLYFTLKCWLIKCFKMQYGKFQILGSHVNFNFFYCSKFCFKFECDCCDVVFLAEKTEKHRKIGKTLKYHLFVTGIVRVLELCYSSI